MDIVKKNDVLEILNDIKINYNRGTYSIQGLRRLSFNQLLSWLDDQNNNSYNGLLIGHLTINVTALSTLNTFMVANGMGAITPCGIVTQFMSNTPTVLETEQINVYTSTTTGEVEQYQRYFSVFNCIRVGYFPAGPGAVFYPDKSITWGQLQTWYDVVQSNLISLGSSCESLVSFLGYEAIISV